MKLIFSDEDYDEIDGKIILELDVLVIDPIRNIKAKLQKKIATDLKNYDIWLKQSKVRILKVTFQLLFLLKS